MVIGALTPEISHDTKVGTYSEFNSTEFDDCTPDNNGTPTAAADYVAHIRFNLGNLAAGTAKTVKIYYRKY